MRKSFLSRAGGAFLSLLGLACIAVLLYLINYTL